MKFNKQVIKDMFSNKVKSTKDKIVKRVKEKSTWAGVITAVASIFSISLTGVPVDIIAGAIASTVGGMFISANTTDDK